ncbi:MAG: MFS transporter [Pseudonocardiaceae bacterium]|nr:MFS transporter [Pseudonocardiaceae bacterium]
MRTGRLSVASLYIGGFLGPFAGGVPAAMLPELSADFHVSLSAASASLTAYLLPLAALMLFSGTLGERWGRARSIRIAYLVYLASSVVCATAEEYPLFLAGRMVQGCANAFTMPLLLAAIGSVTPQQRLGRALGLYGSMQAAGQSFAPFLGGLAAELSWRLAFAAVAAAAVGLAAIRLPGPAEIRAGEPPRLRTAWRPDVLRIALVALVAWASLGGLAFLVATRYDEAFGLGAGARGLVLTGFGVAGLLSARLIGGAVDRVGARRCVLLGGVTGALAIGLFGVTPWLVLAIVLWTLAGVSSQLVLVGLNALTLGGERANRGGAVSVVQAFRFLGAAGSPVAFLPVYHLHPVAGFLVPALLLMLVSLFRCYNP